MKALIKNNKLAEGIRAQVIAVLRKDGERIIAVASANDHKIEKRSYDDIPEEIKTTDITVPDEEGKYEISVYLWDGLDTMKILAPSKTYKEQGVK